MKLLNWARRLFKASDDEDHWITLKGPIAWLSSAVQAAGGSTNTGKWINSDTALRCSAVWRAVDLLSSLPALMPLKVHRARPDGGSDIDRKHPNFLPLYLQPNPWMTSFQWRKYMGMSLHLRGNAYSAIKIRPDGAVDRLVPIHPDRVQVLVDDDGYPVYEVTPSSGNGEPIRMLHHEMHHLWLHSTNGYEGISPITANRESIGLALGAEEYGSRLLSNGGVLSGVLKIPDGASPEARTEAKKSWQEGHRGLSNAHKVAVLEQGMDFTPISMSSVDAQWIEMRKFQVEEIARIYGIPPELLQHTSPVSSWGTGVEQRFLAFLATRLDPDLVAWEQRMQCDFFLPEEVDLVYPRFGRAALLRTDILTRYRVYAIGRQWGILSANECRGHEEMNPIGDEAGNTYLDPTNMDRIPPDASAIADNKPRNGQEQAIADFLRTAFPEGVPHA